ncbi:MAG: hypothetical protein AB7F67_03990 [Rhodospirillaceae bacterium]
MLDVPPAFRLHYPTADAALRAALGLAPGRSIVYFTGDLACARGRAPDVRAVADTMRRLAERDRVGVLAQRRRPDGWFDYEFTRVNLARLPATSELSPHKRRAPRRPLELEVA